jgi:fermentation-respiration switch protein FrsA (DUF1100 family)
MRLADGLLKSLPLFLGSMLIPSPASAALEHMFLYFPDTQIIMTPANMRLEYEDVFFAAEDGTKLHGWYLPGAPGQPVVVFCHGNAGNISHRVDNLRRFRELGLAVFIFDYRGYGQSQGKATEKGTYSDMRGAISWLKTRGWQNQQMIYFGRSLGAGVTLQLALEQPPAGLVLESPFTSIRAMGQHHYKLLWLLAGWAIDARYDNIGKIAQLKVPLMIFHGEQDQIVPLEMGKHLYQTAPEPKWFYPIPRAGHNDTYDRGGVDYWQQWQKFLTELE